MAIGRLIGRERKSKKPLSKSRSRTAHGTTQEFLPDISIYNGMYIVKDARGTHYIKVLPLSGAPFWNLTIDKRNSVLRQYFSWVKTAPRRWGFTTLTTATDITEYVTNIRMDTIGMSDKLQHERDLYIDWVQRMSETTVTNNFFLWFEFDPQGNKKYTKDRIASELDNTAAGIANYFRHTLKLSVTVWNSYEKENEFLEETLYKYLNRESPVTYKERCKQVMEDLQLIKGGGAACRLADKIAPSSADTTNPSFLRMNGRYYKIIYVKPLTRAREEVATWPNVFTQYGKNVSLSVQYEQMPKDSTLHILEQNSKLTEASKSNSTMGSANSEKDMSITNSEFLHARMQKDGEELWRTYIVACITANSVDQLQWYEEKLTKQLKMSNMEFATATNCCREAFFMTLPIGYATQAVTSNAEQNFLTQGLASMFCFSDNALTAKRGGVLGIGPNMTSWVIDPFDTNICSSANGWVSGKTGAGKSFTMSCLLRHWVLSGIKIRMILPKKGAADYLRTTESVDGTFIPFKPGSPYCVNLFEIRPEDNESFNAQSLRSKKIRDIRIWFMIRGRDDDPKEAFSTKDCDMLSTVVCGMYDAVGITEDNQSILDFKNEGKPFPTFSTLDKHCVEELKKTTWTESEINSLDKIRRCIRPCISGGARNLNGQTNVSLDNPWVVFDVDVDVCGDMMPEYYYIAMGICKADAKRDQLEQVILFYDELQEVLTPTTAKDVAEQYSTLRSYGSGVFCATQSVENLNIASDSTNGRDIKTTILANSDIRILLQMKENELPNLKKAFSLQDEALEYLLAPQVGENMYPELTSNNNRGCGLIMVGPYNLYFRSCAMDTVRNDELGSVDDRFYEFRFFNTDAKIAKKLQTL